MIYVYFLLSDYIILAWFVNSTAIIGVLVLYHNYTTLLFLFHYCLSWLLMTGFVPTDWCISCTFAPCLQSPFTSRTTTTSCLDNCPHSLGGTIRQVGSDWVLYVVAWTPRAWVPFGPSHNRGHCLMCQCCDPFLGPSYGAGLSYPACRVDHLRWLAPPASVRMPICAM